MSDVHLGVNESNKEAFLSFLREVCDTPDLDCLILLGDIFDFWRVNNAQIIMDNPEIMETLTSIKAKKVYYIAGNHDYHILSLANEFPGTLPFTVQKELRLQSGDKSFYFIHGYQIELYVNMEPLTMERYEKFADKMCSASNIVSYIADHFWDVLTDNGFLIEHAKMRATPQWRRNLDKMYIFSKTPGAYLLLGMKPGESLVFGHTHRPFITTDKRVANTGCWTNEKHISEKWQNTYIEIIDGDMYLRKYS